jgi:thiol:disulfide interchange protein
MRVTCSLMLIGVLVSCQQSGEHNAESSKPARGAAGPELVLAAEAGDVAEYVAAELARAKADGYRLLVYVSANWCEPCKHLEVAVKEGSLRDRFSDLRLLKFDLDRDEARLADAGYSSKLIPLFVIPGDDGRGTGRRLEGSVKGPEAVAQNLAPRLELLLK